LRAELAASHGIKLEGSSAMIKTIQAILRHEDVSTTQRSYIKTPARIVTDAVKQLESTIACATGFGELIRKLMKRWSRRADLNR
jgi:integrase